MKQSRKRRRETMWGIALLPGVGVIPSYTSTTRKQAIADIVANCQMTWRDLRRSGYQAVKLTVYYDPVVPA